MRRGPIRKDMQRARQTVRAGMAAGQRDQTVDGLIRYRVARVKLADAKGHDLPAYSAKFDAPQRRRDSGVPQEIAEHLRLAAEWDREAGQ